MSKLQTILDVDGNILYQEIAASKKVLIQTLADRKASLARADLSNLNLRRVNFRGADLVGAKLDRSNLAGANLCNANLQSASLAGTRMAGVEAQRTRFEGAQLENADLAGSTISFSNFRGAKLDGASFARCNASSTVFTHVVSKGANFGGAKLRNSNFSNSTIQNCDFRGADLSTTLPLNKAHLPNRTHDSIILNCLYDKSTVFCQSVGGMSRDASRSRIARTLGWVVPSILLGAALTLVPEVESGLLSVNENMGAASAGVILALGLAATVKASLEDWVKDKAVRAADELQLQYRKALASARRLAMSKSGLVAAIATRSGLEPLRLALEAVRAGSNGCSLVQDFIWLASDNDAVIICDRQHLAQALGVLSVNETRNYAIQRDTILVFPGSPAADITGAPSALRFHEDGSMTAVWGTGANPVASVTYPSGHGKPVVRGGTGIEAPSKVTAITRFRGRILENAALSNFTYPLRSHYVQPGQDDSILVYQGSSRRLDNPFGPAVITPDGKAIYFRNGTRIKEETMPGQKPEEATASGLSPAF